MPTRVPDRLSAALLGLEALALAIVAGWEVVALVGGDTADVTSSIALVVLTVVGASAVAAFGVATVRGRSWGRSGGIVTQLLMLAVVFGAIPGPAPAYGFALAVAIPAVAGLVLLFTAVRRAGARSR